MTMNSLAMPRTAIARPGFLSVATILASAIVAMGNVGPAAADSPARTTQDPTEATMARCQQLAGLWSRHNTTGYAKPLEVDLALEDCRKGNYASGVASLKRALDRAQIPVPPTETARSR